jgi:hypothetical protein
VNTSDTEPPAITKWDPALTEQVMGLIRPVIKSWHRAEVHDILFTGPTGDFFKRTGFIPFSLSMVLPVNMPLPTKIVTQVLPPIDVVAEFGEDPDVDEVDAHVRHVMQQALDALAAERRLPVIG